MKKYSISCYTMPKPHLCLHLVCMQTKTTAQQRMAFTFISMHQHLSILSTYYYNICNKTLYNTCTKHTTTKWHHSKEGRGLEAKFPKRMQHSPSEWPLKTFATRSHPQRLTPPPHLHSFLRLCSCQYFMTTVTIINNFTQQLSNQQQKEK